MVTDLMNSLQLWSPTHGTCLHMPAHACSRLRKNKPTVNIVADGTDWIQLYREETGEDMEGKRERFGVETINLQKQ